MIHAALWILAAFIVIATLLIFGGGLLYLLFADGRWIYTVGLIVAAIVWFNYTGAKQRQASEARMLRNTPLQQECISQAQNKARQKAQEAIDGRYDIPAYRSLLISDYQTAESNCKINYPIY